MLQISFQLLSTQQNQQLQTEVDENQRSYDSLNKMLNEELPLLIKKSNSMLVQCVTNYRFLMDSIFGKEKITQVLQSLPVS